MTETHTDDWNVDGAAGVIVSLERLERLRSSLDVLILTSGGFDPIHPGHISVILAGKRRVIEYTQQNILAKNVVVVNGDSFLCRKKGRPFMSLQTRCMIVAAITGVDIVVPFISEDNTVCEVIERLRPTEFLKGGDRVDEKSIPEWDICQRVGTRILPGIGLPKNWSSSDFLRDWETFIKGREGPA
jgi:cytidyltransferase-like protein